MIVTFDDCHLDRSIMSRRMRINKNFIKFIYEATSKQRKHILSHVTKDQIDLISEIALNIIKGIFPNKVTYIKALVPYKSLLVRLSSKKKTFANKKKLLLRYPQILPRIVKPVLGHI